ncbi:MAG: S-methyl-5-thioribose-1-phosphate isomerase [Candidatus Brocadiales bacterium]|nr:S-methyl-5-thioribose-1-phosphate isomerase [Candidatus Bathyanammoxibius amoris]
MEKSKGQVSIPTIEWEGGADGRVKLIDQTLLPGEFKFIYCDNKECLWEAIKMLRVRGAPAIGIAAAMGVFLGIRNVHADNFNDFFLKLQEVTTYLGTARPTAVNLFWALERMEHVAQAFHTEPVETIKEFLFKEALEILEEDRDSSKKIGEHGAALIPRGSTVMTYCNAGGLATGGYGTALAVIYAAKAQGKVDKVFACETRPLLQGARLTSWELLEAGLDVTLICDNMAAHVMAEKKIDAVVVGSDRIAANGDAANKIGSYGLSIIAKEHKVPFYVAAPISTFDMKISKGSDIPIEERSPDEVTYITGHRIAPDGVNVFNPAFDVIPAGNIRAIITEKGVVKNPTTEGMKKLVEG